MFTHFPLCFLTSHLSPHNNFSHIFSARTAQFCFQRLRPNVQPQDSGHRFKVIIVLAPADFNPCGLWAENSFNWFGLSELEAITTNRLRNNFDIGKYSANYTLLG